MLLLSGVATFSMLRVAAEASCAAGGRADAISMLAA
jgi:hypothetical protein